VTQDLFVTGTDTNVGKTLLSALLVAALGRNYWKPIQTGACEGTDREAVMKWAHVGTDRVCAESYIFDAPVSPHLAANQQGITIDMQRVRRPVSSVPLIIEGAGGVLVPINDKAFMLDLMRHIGAPVIVAARTALGTINHTLLTLSVLRGAGVVLHGVIMIGKEDTENRRAVEHYGNVQIIGHIPWLERIDHAALCAVFNRCFDARAFR
jgi:dethiobiotin synthetase